MLSDTERDKSELGQVVEKKSSIVERVKQRTKKKLEARELHLSSLSQRRLDVVAEHESENEHSQKDMKPGTE